MNKWIGMGRLTKDLELKYSASNLAVLNFRLAINRDFAKKGEEKQADFINCVAFDKTAEFIAKYFYKGRLILIKDSRIQTRTWDDKEGKKHYVTEIFVKEVGFTGEKNDKQADSHEPKPNNSQQDGFYPVVEDDDELPF